MNTKDEHKHERDALVLASEAENRRLSVIEAETARRAVFLKAVGLSLIAALFVACAVALVLLASTIEGGAEALLWGAVVGAVIGLLARAR